jgi:hypothetical protein
MNGSTTDASSSDPAFTRGISVGTNGVWYECQAPDFRSLLRIALSQSLVNRKGQILNSLTPSDR